MASTIDYKGDGTGNGLSRSVWADFDERALDQMQMHLDHFLNTPDQVTTEVHGGWQSYLDTGCTAAVTADAANGVIALTCDATGSDEEVGLQWDASQAPYAVISTAGSEKRLWYETRIALSSVSLISAYIGLCDGGVLADGLLADGGTGINDKDFIGYRILEADPDGIDAVYRTGATEVVLKDEAQVAAINTYYKLGFYYDKKYVNYYVDGVLVGRVLATATSFPDGVYMAPLFAIKQHEAAAKVLSVDYVAIGMEL